MAEETQVDALADLSLEQLSNIVVTSVSRQQMQLSSAPTSIFVISSQDIRRAGATSIPEALRLAPNLQVARLDARNYAVTARGFNSAFENKLLMLIDGRSVYTPLFSGVFWDIQDVLMEDIDRIEVISGPGATIWGANAVNGVINVITRPAGETPGGLASFSASGREKTASFRYGGKLANGGDFRGYARYAGADETSQEDGTATRTGWRRRQAGFRTDWQDHARRYTFQGDAYNGELGQFGTDDIRIAGANLTGRINSALADGSNVRLQAYWDHTERNQPGAFIERLDTLDLEFQHGFKTGATHDISWGAGYRVSWDRVENGPAFAFLPGSLRMHWANLFAQDEIALRQNLRLTLGLKLEHNNYTGLETLPTMRLAWTPGASQLIWTSLSRTVRSPSRIDRDFFVPGRPVIIGNQTQFLVAGGPDFSSEVANVLELGYRAQPRPALSYSATAFYSDYDKLRTLEPRPTDGSVFSNGARGTARGIEMWGTWHAARDWRMSAGLVEQRIDTRLKAGSMDTSGSTGIATNDPQRYAMIRSSHDISDRLQLDLTLRYVGKLPEPPVPSYHEMDLRVEWQARPDLDVALVGNNLLHASHAEFGNAPVRSAIERNVLLQVTYRFK
jgi:iron complex outermembrane recepter protein